MTATSTKSVNMTFPALYSYVLNTNYRSAAGVMSLFISIACLAVAIVKWDVLQTNQRVGYILVGCLFTVVNPLLLAFKTYRQLKLSVSYKLPLTYTFSDKGVTISRGEEQQEMGWDMICRILMTGSILAIYTSRVHAFVIPLSELGDDKGKIIASVVQFSAANNPKISKNLKRFQSGKGL